MLQLKHLLPLFFSVAGVVILFITFRLKLERDTKKAKENLDVYLTKDFNALFARKKEIPESFFISVDFNSIPSVNNDECTQFYNQINKYADTKMTHLKGYTNIELKEAYGMIHFENLTCYEKNYLTFMDILVKYGSILYEKGFAEEAETVLKKALDYECDVSKCYMLLSDIYLKRRDSDSLETLTRIAKQNMNGSYYLKKVLNKIESAQQAIE